MTNKPQFWARETFSPNDIQAFKKFGTAGPGQCFIYQLFDDNQQLLYVGITWNPFDRWRSHRKKYEWWQSVVSAAVWICESERNARTWETWCIKNLSPIHNKHQKRK